MGENRPNSSKMIHSDGVQQVSGKCTSKTNVLWRLAAELSLLVYTRSCLWWVAQVASQWFHAFAAYIPANGAKRPTLAGNMTSNNWNFREGWLQNGSRHTLSLPIPKKDASTDQNMGWPMRFSESGGFSWLDPYPSTATGLRPSPFSSASPSAGHAPSPSRGRLRRRRRRRGRLRRSRRWRHRRWNKGRRWHGRWRKMTWGGGWQWDSLGEDLCHGRWLVSVGSVWHIPIWQTHEQILCTCISWILICIYYTIVYSIYIYIYIYIHIQ